MSDQDVLTALLSSLEYADIPIQFLRRGYEIIQYFGSSGYTMRERMQHLFSQMPPFVHSQGYKPWWPIDAVSQNGISARFNRLYQEVTPYVYLARHYRPELDSADWLEPRTRFGKWLDRLAFGRAPLLGMPLALVADAVRIFKGMVKASGVANRR
jgi:hypothetical protein